MARIRTTKPEFWTSQQVVGCSMNARLLFIGLWNFCDDHGIHPAEPKRLKMEVFPGDDCTIEQIADWIGELVQADLLREYEADGRRYWLVTGWHHQRIDRPSYKHPLPPANDSANAQGILDEHSSNNRRTLDERHPPEGKGKEGKGMESVPSPYGEGVGGDAANPSAEPRSDEPRNGERRPATPPCPHQEMISLYHETLPMCPRVREWNKTRGGLLRARWKDKPERQSLDWWREFFGYVAQSRFLTGQAEPREGKPPFVADLEWLLRPSNFAKVIEGKYHDPRTRRAA